MADAARGRGGVPHGLRIGAHMSIEGGFHHAVERAARVRASALQIFVKSARRWSAAPIEPAAAGAFRDAVRRHGLERHTLAHASYLINLASARGAVRERSIRALGEELRRCAALGVPYLVLHPGAHVGAGAEAGLRRVLRALDRVLASRGSPREVSLLLENTAGQGSTLGHDFGQLGWLLRRAGAGERLGVCFDTCHALAAGYGLADPGSYRRTFEAFDREIGLERLRAFHLNDSRFREGSRRDRHEHIGAGHVGLDGFRRIVTDRRFRGLPMVLETPKLEDLRGDRRNLATLRRLAAGARPTRARA